MNSKTLLTTLFVAVLAAGVAVVVVYVKPWEEKAPDSDAEDVVKSLFDFEKDQIDRIEVTVRTAREPRRVFVRDDDEWNIAEPIEAPANRFSVEPILTAMQELEAVKEYARSNRNRPRDKTTGLDEPRYVVSLFGNGEQVAQLTVGKRLPIGKGLYVMRAKDAEGEADESIYEAKQPEFGQSLTDVLDKSLNEYRNKTVTNVDIDDVTAVEVTGVANFELARSDDTWMIEEPFRGRAVKTKAEDVARKVGRLTVREWFEDQPDNYAMFGLGEPPMRLKATLHYTREVPPKARPGDPDTQPADIEPTTVEETKTLLVGGEAGDDTYFARYLDRPWVFTISQSDVETLTPDLADLREPSLADVDNAKVTRIEATTPAGSMTLTKTDGEWTFADGSECDTTAVDDLLKSVDELEATSFVPADALSRAGEWRDNPRAEIRITEQGDPDPTTILVGPPTVSGKMVYVANAAEESVAAVYEEDVIPLLAGPVAYRDRKVMDFPRDRAKRIVIERSGAEELALVRSDNAWSMVEPVEASVDSGAVSKLLRDLSSLRATRIVGTDRAEFGLDDPEVTVAVHVLPLTAEPNAKIAGEPDVEEGTKDAEVADEPATRPATTRPARKDPPPGMSTEELLEYVKSLPTEDNDPSGLPKQNPLAIEMLEKKLAEERAATQPGTTATAPAATTRPAGTVATATQPAEPATAQPTIYRILLTQQGGKTYACMSDGELVYELDSHIYDDATAEMHERQIADFEVTDVVEVTFARGEEELTFRKSGEDEWKYAADPLLPIDAEKVKESLNDFADLQTHRFVSYDAENMAKYGLAEPDAVTRVAIAREGAEPIEILVSDEGPKADPDESHYATKVGSDQVFLLKGEQADKCTRKLEDFEKSGSE